LELGKLILERVELVREEMKILNEKLDARKNAIVDVKKSVNNPVINAELLQALKKQ
jgi:hypothetical protein